MIHDVEQRGILIYTTTVSFVELREMNSVAKLSPL